MILDLMLSLLLIETISPKQTRNLLSNPLLIFISCECFLETSGIQLDQKLVKLLVHLLVQDNLSPELQRGVTILHEVLAV